MDQLGQIYVPMIDPMDPGTQITPMDTLENLNTTCAKTGSMVWVSEESALYIKTSSEPEWVEVTGPWTGTSDTGQEAWLCFYCDSPQPGEELRCECCGAPRREA
jgi:hypothetical protein